MTPLEALNTMEQIFIHNPKSQLQEFKDAYFILRDHLVAIGGRDGRQEIQRALALGADGDLVAFRRCMDRLRARLERN